MQRYCLDEDLLKQALKRSGYARLSHFAKQKNINRMTLHHYLNGKGPFSEIYYEICNHLMVDPLTLLKPVETESKVVDQDKIMPIVQKIIQAEPSLAVGLLGSRAKGKSKKYSDWDLGVTLGSAKLSSKNYLLLKTAVEDLAEDLPWFVDVVNLDQAPRWFLQGITYQPVFLGGRRESWEYFLGALHGSQSQD